MNSTTPDRHFSRLRRSHLFMRVAWVAPMLALSLLAAGPAVFAAPSPRVLPTASFTNTPTNPVVGELVTFTATSSDPDGTIVDYPEPGPPSPGSTPPPASFPAPVANGRKPPKPTLVGPRLLDPFPLVRIRGVTTPRGARLDLLSVRTLGGTKILVRCKGRGCPWARKTERARFSARRLRAVNMPGFKRRHLRAGTVLEVFVTQKGMIGKYTRFKIRRLKAPLRTDSCTAPGVARVRRCPA